MNSAPDPDDIVIQLGVPADKRRVTVEDHRSWREILSQGNAMPVDPIDDLIADIRHARKEEKQ